MDAYQAAREELSEFRQQDDYLLAHGASLMSEDSHEILHTDTLRRAVAAATAQQTARIERLRAAMLEGARILDADGDEWGVAHLLRDALEPNDADSRRASARSAGVQSCARPQQEK